MSENKDIAILIPFRNEEKNLPLLLDDLSKLNFQEKVDLILINDHSSDNSVNLIQSHSLFPNLKLLNLNANSYGKKKALELGVEHSSCDFFWSLDADIRILDFDLELLSSWRIQKPDLLILPVVMLPGKTCIRHIQFLEWQLLQTWTFVSASCRHPLMANGANLFFRRQLFLKQNQSRFSYLSGDDMNLLHKAMELKSKVSFQNSKWCSVHIHGVDSWRDYFVQRWRWSGKMKHYPKSAFHLFSFLFFFWNFLILASLILTLFNVMFIVPAVFFALIQVAFVRKNQRKLKVGASHFGHFCFAFVFPFISFFFFITSNLVRVKWKGRDVSLSDVTVETK